MSEEINERFKQKICNIHYGSHIEMWKNLFKSTVLELEEMSLFNDRLCKEMDHLDNVVEYSNKLSKIILKTILKDEICSICHDKFNSENEFSVTDCGHYFHKNCLSKLFEISRKSDCPLCREEIFKETLNLI